MPVAVDGHGLAAERLRDEPGDDAAVPALVDAWAVRVEVPHDGDRQPPVTVCEREMLVTIRWQRTRKLAVPLAQLEAVNADQETQQAIDDWHYWVGQGHTFY